ncbi:hypothetical protein [Sporomusa acidovorans]|uniref:Uncharacterized protein n=1 Tax=Sporomusa acidovorans (strain ATCC 49682 / DSM 3132 / Mol) TaxID=1123286 RepID=A0ABZ3J417_SPOA4|nr:hypothetical protein [Sporomusa acidovorans]OZC20289.1 hypothetical protein SPACI_26880 [Sporomusa acidovorans DSM 3132]SDD39103.1 hypothetical protein SAMN04488499_100195 [Sporomusa acidovorans]
MRPLEQVMDALDVETFFVCDNEQQGRSLMLELLRQWGLSDIDVVFAQHMGPGIRVRGRAYIYRPADRYSWILPDSERK